MSRKVRRIATDSAYFIFLLIIILQGELLAKTYFLNVCYFQGNDLFYFYLLSVEIFASRLPLCSKKRKRL